MEVQNFAEVSEPRRPSTCPRAASLPPLDAARTAKAVPVSGDQPVDAACDLGDQRPFQYPPQHSPASIGLNQNLGDAAVAAEAFPVLPNPPGCFLNLVCSEPDLCEIDFLVGKNLHFAA